MRTTVALIGVLAMLHQAQAQTAPAIAWQSALGGTDRDDALAIVATADGGSIMAGVSYSDDGDVSSNNGSGDVWLVKLDALGAIQWEKNYGGSDQDCARDVMQTSDGGYLVTAYTKSDDGDVPLNHGNQDAWVLKLDAAGNIQWQTVRGGSGQEQPWTCDETADGYLIGGGTGSNDWDVSGNHGSFDMWVFKLSLTGAFQWQRCYGGTWGEDLADAQALSDGGLVFTGHARSIDGDVTLHGVEADIWVVRLDATGNILWEHCFGGSSGEEGWSVQATLDGGFVVGGWTTSTDGMVTGQHGGQDLWVLKLDASGALQWQKALGGAGEEAFGLVAQLPDGRYAVLGEAWSTDGDLTANNGSADFWVAMLDANGDLQWQKNMGGTSWERGHAIALSNDGGILAAGVTSSDDGDVTGYHLPYTLQNTDCWVVKLGNDMVGIAEHASPSIQLMPNPGQGRLQITLDPALVGARYSIVDLTGRVQQEAIVQAARMDLDVEDLHAGAYVLKIHSTDGVLAQRWVKE